LVSVPGRVNLIGEHTDYSYLPVLPMAIHRRVAIAAATADRFEIHSSAEPTPVVGPPGMAGWHRYLAAALTQSGYEPELAAVITSDLPVTGGLASSTALTIGFMAALTAVAGERVVPDAIAQAALAAERLAGVESGAMDQTVIIHGRKDAALRIDFAVGRPPSVELVPLPADLRTVVAYSGEPAHKGAGARHAYNRSVVACRAAAVLIGRVAGLPALTGPVLGEVAGVTGALELAADLASTMTARAAAGKAGVDPAILVHLATGEFDPDEPLSIRAAAVHVLSEAVRVDQAEAALVGGDVPGFGRLLDASHASLADFGASTPRLDTLTAAMRRAGALGARLTGAGFGGNAVGVCLPSRLEAVIEAARMAGGGPAFEVSADTGLTLVET
jgi:galactokinase